MSEFVKVLFETSRTVRIDGAPQGKTNKVLTVQRGTHRFDLSTPPNYTPSEQRERVVATTETHPFLIEFARIPASARVAAIRRRAAAENVLEPFDRFIRISEYAGLFVRPYTLTVMITPPRHRGRFLMSATPRAGGICISAGPDAFAEFFDVSGPEAAEALNPGNVRQFLTGEALDARIEQIGKFLTEKLPASGDRVGR